MRRLVPVLVCALMLGAGASAQPIQPSVKLGEGLSSFDRSYLARDATLRIYASMIAQLAIEKATRNDVKDYAMKVLTEGTDEDQARLDLATKKNIDLPVALSPTDQSKMDALERAAGPSFDSAYLREVMRIATEARMAASGEANRTHDPDLRAFVASRAKAAQQEEKVAARLYGVK